MIETRKLGEEHAGLWQQLRLDGLRHFPAAFLFSEVEAKEVPSEQITAMLGHGDTFGAWLDGQPAGIGSLVRETARRARHRASIGAFYVQPHAQGRGVAEALLEAIVAHAKSLGVWQLELFVAASNPRAVRFYQRNGFESVGKLPNAILVETGPVDDFFCVRLLDH